MSKEIQVQRFVSSATNRTSKKVDIEPFRGFEVHNWEGEMEWTQWHEFCDRLNSLDVKYRLKPHVRYPGSIGEQATLFINDPSGNAIELKSFQDDTRLFATLSGSEHAPGGGRL